MAPGRRDPQGVEEMGLKHLGSPAVVGERRHGADRRQVALDGELKAKVAAESNHRRMKAFPEGAKRGIGSVR
jgi:hypothetical protein